MAVTETRTLPPKFIETLATDYGKQLTGLTAQQMDTAKYAPQVAGQDPYQTQAYTRAGTQGQGIGAYSPYITAAGAQGTLAGAQGTAAGTTLGQVSPYITAAGSQYTGAGGLTGPGAGTGAGSIASYMSPYQQQVIDTSLAEFDKQAAISKLGLGTQAIGAGAYGGARHGVAESEYQSSSDLNRARLNAQLLQGGYGQASGARQQDLASRMGLGTAQLGLGQATGALAGQQQQLGQFQQGLGQYQQGLAGLVPQLQAGDISMLGQVGAGQQAQAQAQLDATREQERMKAYEPYERLGYYGTGVTGIMGGYPGQYQSQITPNPTPLQTAMGIGATGAGIWGTMRGDETPGRISQFGYN